MSAGLCECGERCSCPPGSEARARCSCWHEGPQEPTRIYGLVAFSPVQKPLIEKHCFGDCGKVSMAGAIEDEELGPLWICCEERCPWLALQTDKPIGTTNSYGRPHEVYLRALTDTPARLAPAPAAQPGVRWQRREGFRGVGGLWQWPAWRDCSEADARRVEGLESWQCQRLDPLEAGDITGADHG